MADFTMQELAYDGDLQRYVAGGRDKLFFQWSAKAQTMPLQPFTFGLETRTVREDYAGNDRPVEQIMGTSYTAFTLEGNFNDKWAGEGFAQREREKLEELVRKCSPVRITFEDLTFDCVLKRANFHYRRKWDVGYSLEFSPHFRDTSVRTSGKLGTATPALDIAALIDAIAARMKAIQDLSPVRIIQGTLHGDVGALLLEMAVLAQVIALTVTARVLRIADNGAPSIARLASSMESMRKKAFEIRDALANASSTTDIYFQDTMAIANFDAWAKEMSTEARKMAVACFEGARDLRSRVTPDAQALYRPTRGESIYDIANQFFGKPDAWRVIADRNNLGSAEFTGTEMLVIPKLVG